MQISKSKQAATVALLILVLGFSFLLHARPSKSPSDQEHAKAVSTIRLINTAELSYKLGSETENGAIEAHLRYAT